MPNKIILLTIFLYITLNLRKIENFIQNGYKIESFTAEKAERAALVSLETRMQIALLKSFGLIIFIYFIAPKKEGNLSIFLKHNRDSFIMLILFILVGLIAGFYFTNMLDLQWMTIIENVINEIASMTFIYVVVKIAMRDSEKNSTETSNEDLNSYAEKILGLLNKWAPETADKDKQLVA